MFCPKCGSNVPDSTKFCPTCGALLADEAQQAPATEPQPQYQPQQPVYQAAPADNTAASAGLPQTGDAQTPYIGAGLVLAAMAIVVIIAGKKRN